MVVVLVVPKTLLRARSPLQAGVGGYIYNMKIISYHMYGHATSIFHSKTLENTINPRVKPFDPWGKAL